MPAARYWRIIGIETYGGGDLELSEVALYDGATRVDGSATLTSSHAPIAGSLANLKDADTGTTARFAGADVFLPGFALQWDFGSDQNVDDVQFTMPAEAIQCGGYTVEYLVGAVWTFAFYWSGRFGGTPKTQQYDDPLSANVDGLWNFNGIEAASTDTSFRSSCRASLIATTSGSIGGVTAVASVGLGTLVLRSTNSQAIFPAKTFSGDFCIELRYCRDNGSGNLTNSVVLSLGDGLPALIHSNVTPQLAVIDGANTIVLQGNTSVSISLIHHIAWVRQAGVHRLYVNGVLQTQTWSNTEDYAATNLLTTRSGYNRFYGFIDYLRLTYGAARYTSAFTPPGAGSLPGFSSPSPTRSQTSTPTLISEYTPPPFTTATAQPVLLDLTFGGTATVTGTVKRYDDPAFTPVARRVRLYDEQARQMARETWSDPTTGAFTFTGVRADRKYTVMALDHLGQYRAVIIDRVEAV